jgi:A/G-specific adenine glycosylase
MLQQTQVSRVRPKYQAWIKAFPTVQALAQAPLKKVLQLWSGLGYNSRAVRLRQAAQTIVVEHSGQVPMNRAALMALPGLGQYTAGAVLTFAGRQRVGVVDTNVRKVVGRFMFGTRPVNEKKLYQTVEALVPARHPDQWNHALMDLGATVCFNRRPDCEHCPLQADCRAYPAILRQPQDRRLPKQGTFLHSDRYWRGKIVQTLLQHPGIKLDALEKKLKPFGSLPRTRRTRLLNSLEGAGIVKQGRSGVVVAA